MGANINANMKMSRRQMRLCQALKLVPVYPVAPQALHHADDYDSGIDRTSPETIYFQNQSMAEEVVTTTANTIQDKKVKSPILKTLEFKGRKLKEDILEKAENKLVEKKSVEDRPSDTGILTPASSTEMDIYQDMDSEVHKYEEETKTHNESETKNELQTMFLSCGIRQQGFDMNSLVNNKNVSCNEMRINKLEIWEREKFNAILEIEQKLKELLLIKEKVKRLKQRKKKLLKLKVKQEKIMKCIKQEKLIVKYGPDESNPKQSQVIKTEIEDINYDLVETPSPASPAPSSSATSSSEATSPSTTTKMTPYNKFQQNPSFTPLKSPVAMKLDSFKTIDFTTMPCDKYDLLTIGPNGTKVAKAALQNINWSLSGAAVTRKILMEVFDRETLAFHTLTGKPSPAFLDCDKPMKGQLDPLKVADIIHIVTHHLNLTEKEVRQAITTKCADENKMFRQRERKRISLEQEE